jgi:hypothetical protein
VHPGWRGEMNYLSFAGVRAFGAAKKKTRAYVFRRSEGYNTTNCKMDTNEPNELQHRKIMKNGAFFFGYFLFRFLEFSSFSSKFLKTDDDDDENDDTVKRVPPPP